MASADSAATVTQAVGMCHSSPILDRTWSIAHNHAFLSGKKLSKDENANISAPSNEADVKGHKLQTPWSFWYSKKTSGSSASAEGFSSSLKHLGSFETIEGFLEYVLIQSLCLSEAR